MNIVMLGLISIMISMLGVMLFIDRFSESFLGHFLQVMVAATMFVMVFVIPARKVRLVEVEDSEGQRFPAA